MSEMNNEEQPQQEWHEIRFDLPGNRTVWLNLGNCAISLFRDEPEKDYLDIIEYSEEEDVERHTWIFKHRDYLIWLGGVVLNVDDFRTLYRMNKENGGAFTRYSGGWRPNVDVWQYAQPWENELYAQTLLSDLEDSDTFPEDFLKPKDDSN